jgi:hypothetical protein
MQSRSARPKRISPRGRNGVAWNRGYAAIPAWRRTWTISRRTGSLEGKDRAGELRRDEGAAVCGDTGDLEGPVFRRHGLERAPRRGETGVAKALDGVAAGAPVRRLL